MDQKTRKMRVLIAAAPESKLPIQNFLSEEFTLSFANSMVEVMEQPYLEIDFIVCGLYFDESRMFDFLRYAKLDLQAQKVPFICVNAIRGALSPTLRQSVDIACRALGAATFIDLCYWQDEIGIEETHKKFRELIELHSFNL
jgi:hypothetical protein